MLETLTNIDGSILLWIQENLRAEWMHRFWITISSFVDGGWIWIVLGVIFLLFKKTRPMGLAVLVALMVNQVITNMILKNLIARPRPYVTFPEIQLLIEKSKSYSFPSGHTATSFAAAWAIAAFANKKCYGIVAFAFAAMVGFSRLYVGIHYPGDVLGGIISGILSGILTVIAIKSVMPRKRRER